MKNDDDEHASIIQKTEQPHTTTHKKQTQPTKPQTKNICIYSREQENRCLLKGGERLKKEGRMMCV